MDSLAIETNGLTKFYGRKAIVRDLNLKVPRGKSCGFLGPNGAGKTSTMRMLLGLTRPSSGTIKILGQESPREIVKINKRVGALIEKPAFYEDMTGWTNLNLFSNIGASATKDQIHKVLVEVGLNGSEDKNFETYSTGMRQRLGIALALLQEPDLILLDEPTSGLDPRGRADIRDLILKLIKEKGVTVFLSTHLLYEVEELCDFVCIIDEGQLVVQGEVRDLLSPDFETVEVHLDTTIKLKESPSHPQEDEAEFFRNLDFVDGVEKPKEGVFILNIKRGFQAEIARLVVQKGWNLSTLMLQRGRLEDFFLKVTRESQ